MRPINELALNAVTVAANAVPTNTQFMVACSVQAIATGTLAGTVKLQFSNDKANIGVAPINWTDIPGASATLSGTPGSFAIPKTDICYEWVRVVFTAPTGAGTVSANLKAFGF